MNIVLLLSLLSVSYMASASPVIKCKDIRGNMVYTQNANDCKHKDSPKSVDYLQTETIPDNARTKSSVNYRIPRRNYIKAKSKWQIYVESDLRWRDKALYDSSLLKLNKSLDDVFSRLPRRAAEKLSNLKIFLLWGERSPLGGRHNGMSYIRKNEPNKYEHLDNRWQHSLIIYSADNLMYLTNLWTNKAIMHELAHAWHIIHWSERHPLIYDTWRQSGNAGRYLKVKDIKGKTINKAYALKNQLEYFAELSAIYFVGGNYFPYDKKGLQKYDTGGYQMIETLWN